MRIDQVAYIQVVAVGGGVLEIGERVHAPRPGCLPGGVREPHSRRESFFGGSVTVVRNDQERDVFVLPVGILESFQAQKLRVVFVEEDAVIGGEFEPADAACRRRDPDQAADNDRPAGCQHPFGESPCELFSCHAARARHLSETVKVHQIGDSAIGYPEKTARE